MSEVTTSVTSGTGYLGKYLIIQGRKHTWDAEKKLYYWVKPPANKRRK